MCIYGHTPSAALQLPVETLITSVVDAARTPTVTPPVAETFGNYFQSLIADDIHRSALAHGEVMGWVEALSTDIAPRTSPADHPIGPFIETWAVLEEAKALRQLAGHRVAAAQSIAVVFYQPKVVLLTKTRVAAKSKGLPKAWAIITAFVLPGL